MSVYVDIRKNFGGFALDVKFEAGDEIMALLGASGCGKSMTLKCIAGVVRPDEGVIIVDGVTLFDSKKKINLSPQKRRVGFLFQNYALFPNMTVEQNIMSVLRLGDSSLCGEKFASLTERFYIRGLENHYPAQLSGGQQQRVALARIMASDPNIIMLDEPLSALDSYLRWQLENELIDTLDDFKGTTLYVSHNRDEVYRICDRVCVVSDGRSEPVRTLEELFESPDTLASCLLSGCKNYSAAQRVGDRVVRASDWGTDLLCDSPVSDDVRHIGVRAHFITPTDEEDGDNVFECRLLRITDDVFSTIFTLLPIGAESTNDFAHIRMELPKQELLSAAAGDILRVKILQKDIMLLK